MGNKTANLFNKKKTEAEQLAQDKLTDAQKMAEEEAKKVADSLTQAKNETEQLAANTGNLDVKLKL